MKAVLMPSGLDLDQLVREHQADLWWYLRTLGCDAATAEDLTQECFVALMQSDFEARHPRATFGYLRTSARHRYISLLRKQKHLSSQTKRNQARRDNRGGKK